MAEGGVVWSRNSWTTPPRLHELMRLRDFSDRAATPPPAEEGTPPGALTPSWFALKAHSQFGQDPVLYLAV